MNKHYMLDIETLGDKPGCVILSVAAVAFDPFASPSFNSAALETFSHNVEVVEQIMHGAEINAETVEWWQDKDEAAKTALLSNVKSLATVLTMLHNFMGAPNFATKEPPAIVWAKSPDFDCAILEYAAGEMSLPVAWNFRSKRDVRTVIDLPDIMPPVARPTPPSPPGIPAFAAPPISAPPSGPKHVALSDCFNQIEEVQTALRALING